MPRILRPRVAACLLAAAALVVSGSVALSAAEAPNHDRIVRTSPRSGTPNILDGRVLAILEINGKIIAGGTFTQVSNAGSTTVLTRNYLLAFDKTTGAVDTAFVPQLNNDVRVLTPGPTPGTVYAGGRFGQVNGVQNKGVTLLNLADGSRVGTFNPPYMNGIVEDMARVGNELLLGGTFTTIGNFDRLGLGSVNATTGAVTSYLTVSLTEHHNFNGTGAEAPVGADAFAISPDESKLVVIGNFRKADGLDRDQVVMLDLTGPTAAIANWQTNGFTARCASGAFDSWIRGIDFSPDGEYFVIVTTGAGFTGTLCDTASRWEADATGLDIRPTWVDYAGGDSMYSVAITEQAVYIGGHTRWLNDLSRDAAGPGSVGRASIAALDPVNGLPFSWNPGRNPRGFGVTDLYATPDGLWLGYDTDFLGNFQYERQRIGFFPLAGGLPLPPTNVATLPGNVYLGGVVAGTASNVLYRVNTGGPALPSIDTGPEWAADTAATSPFRNTGSNAASFGLVGSVDLTVPVGTPPAVFSDERWDPTTAPEMQWAFGVPAGRNLSVRLYFASRCACTNDPGERVFDVTLDGNLVIDNYDIVAGVGHNRGTMRSWNIVSDGTVNIDFGHVVENPLINAIEIVDLDAPPPPAADTLRVRTYDGNTGVGPTVVLPNPDATQWQNSRGAFWVGGTLFYGMSDGLLYRRTFDGTTLGTPSLVDPYHDNDGVLPDWDTVSTGTGTTTYQGVYPNFYGTELQNVTGIFYAGGRIYYSLLGQNTLFWRWFTPESGVVGAERFTVAGSTGFAALQGMFAANDKLYTVDRLTGDLSVRDFIGGVPSGAPTVLSGPLMDGNDWRARAVFLGP